MRMIRVFSIAVAAVGVLPLLADQGRMPVYQQTTIDAPGAYVVTRDIRVAAGSAITVVADDVLLDLNGFTVATSDPNSPVISVQLAASETGVVRIRNGRVVGGRHGVVASQAKQIYLEGLEIRDASSHGIELTSTRYFEVTSCTIVGAGDRGLNAWGGGTPISGRVVGNTVSGSPDIGILLSDFSGGEVSGNQLDLTGAPMTALGIQGVSGPGHSGNLIARNRIRHDGATGMSLSAGSGGDGGDLVVENIIRYEGTAPSAGAGIALSLTGSVCRDNVVSRHSHGIDVYGEGNHFEGNKLAGNGTGLYFVVGTGNSYRNNVLVGNTTPVSPPGGGGAIDGGGNIQ